MKILSRAFLPVGLAPLPLILGTVLSLALFRKKLLPEVSLQRTLSPNAATTQRVERRRSPGTDMADEGDELQCDGRDEAAGFIGMNVCQGAGR